jgi:hypothetical protein
MVECELCLLKLEDAIQFGAGIKCIHCGAVQGECGSCGKWFLFGTPCPDCGWEGKAEILVRSSYGEKILRFNEALRLRGQELEIYGLLESHFELVLDFGRIQYRPEMKSWEIFSNVEFKTMVTVGEGEILDERGRAKLNLPVIVRLGVFELELLYP